MFFFYILGYITEKICKDEKQQRRKKTLFHALEKSAKSIS
jgi:hypothetical protein